VKTLRLDFIKGIIPKSRTMKHCLTFLPDAYLATKIPDMSGKSLTYGNPTLAPSDPPACAPACVLHQRRTFLSSQASNLLSFLAKALTCPPSGITNRDAHLCPPHNSPSVHLITTSVARRSGQITNGTRSVWTTLRNSVL